MSETQTVAYTPGPWTVMRFDGGAAWGVTATDRVIGTMHGGRNGEANARLIAAAPALLAALKSLAEKSLFNPAHLEAAIEAIAQAEGRQP